MTDAIYVRRLPHLERPTPEVVRPIGSTSEPPDAQPIVCRTATIRVNLGRVLADLEAEARRLLGGAMYE
jgi:hypothetical protein